MRHERVRVTFMSFTKDRCNTIPDRMHLSTIDEPLLNILGYLKIIIILIMNRF